MEKICLQANTIDWIVEDTYKCKKAHKVATASLITQVQMCMKNKLDDWLEEQTYEVNQGDAIQKVEHEYQQKLLLCYTRSK